MCKEVGRGASSTLPRWWEFVKGYEERSVRERGGGRGLLECTGSPDLKSEDRSRSEVDLFKMKPKDRIYNRKMKYNLNPIPSF